MGFAFALARLCLATELAVSGSIQRMHLERMIEQVHVGELS